MSVQMDEQVLVELRRIRVAVEAVAKSSLESQTASITEAVKQLVDRTTSRPVQLLADGKVIARIVDVQGERDDPES